MNPILELVIDVIVMVITSLVVGFIIGYLSDSLYLGLVLAYGTGITMSQWVDKTYVRKS